MELNTNMTKKDLYNAKVSSDKAEGYIDKYHVWVLNS